MQRLACREGWFNNLTKTLFQVSSTEDDDDDEEGMKEGLEKRRLEMEKECQQEREAKIQEGIQYNTNLKKKKLIEIHLSFT